MKKFNLVSSYKPAGDQPNAIEELTLHAREGEKKLCLIGVTGSGKTFTMAGFIQNIQKPVLVLTHNKTLAAQLYKEFKEFFPENAVEYFVSYYDYYQPEAYVPANDLYIEKDASINEEIDRLRLRATSALLERRDVIIVASVSAIYGLGSPEDYKDSVIFIEKGLTIDRDEILKKLIFIQYQRNDINFIRGTFRVRGDILEVFPAYRHEAIRIEWFGDEIESIKLIDPLTLKVFDQLNQIIIYPAKHFITSPPRLQEALIEIEKELQERIEYFKSRNKLLEAERIEARTKYDLEMLRELGYCNGIENYSRHLSGRKAGEHPATLLDYFPDDFWVIIDESHVTIPQIRGMYEGDRSRKQTLVDFGFRLPSALDNRPLNFKEFEAKAQQILFVSATPAEYELSVSEAIVEQIVRPTGLLDPVIEVRSTENQIEDLILEIKKRISKKQRTLVSTLTIKMAEDLTDYLKELNISVAYLHSKIDTIERVEIIRDLRKGAYDVVVGVNLLREGLDIPEVSLVAILDADKEGFLRNARSLIQTIGRAARNAEGMAILYADKITESMRYTIEETHRRRKIQEEFNLKHGITPKTVSKKIDDILPRDPEIEFIDESIELLEILNREWNLKNLTLNEKIETLRKAMLDAASKLEFEKAAFIRDYLFTLEHGEKPNQFKEQTDKREKKRKKQKREK